MSTMFNRLPARPEYIEAVRKALAQGGELGLQATSRLSGLSQTQAACALEELVDSGKVVGRQQSKSPKTVYRLQEA